MNVNGITTNKVNTTTEYDNASKATEASASSKSNSFSEKAAVYESSSKTDRSAIIAKMKQDSEARVSQLKSLVEQMFRKQGQVFNDADSMWKALANGELEVDEETAAKAKEEISEDGYWGVKQTSERIFDFAMALSGGDKNTMEEMRAAFEKGFKEATGSWGKELPEISQKTYDAVQDKFDNYLKGEE